MRSVSVLHIVQTPLDYVGGPATYVKEISRHLAARGVNVGILAPAPSRQSADLSTLSKTHNVNLYFIEPTPHPSLIRTPLIFSIKAHKTIATVAKDYDVINVHVEAALLQSFTDLFNGKKLLLTVHGIYPYEDLETLKHYPLNLHRLIHLTAVSPQHMISLKKLSTKSEYIIPVSKFLASILVNNYRIPREKIVIIPNSVDTEMFKPQPFDKAIEIANKFILLKGYKKTINDKKIILFLGRLEPRKGLHILIRALTMVEDRSWFLIVAGSGQSWYISRCFDLSRKYDIFNHIIFIGRLPSFLLQYFFTLTYVYVLPSVFEGLPTTILEAMACGAPVIATKVSGIPEVIKNNISGLLIEKPDPVKLADALKLILNDEELRKRLSINAINYIRNSFSWKVNIEKYFKLIC